jgi:hypothetical protein
MLDSTVAPLQESDLCIVGIEYMNINCPQVRNFNNDLDNIIVWVV